MQEIAVAESIYGDTFATRCRINALISIYTAYAQIFIVMFEKHSIGQTPRSLERYLVVQQIHNNRTSGVLTSLTKYRLLGRPWR